MQNNQKINDWIAGFLSGEPPRSKSLVMTIFGDAVVPHGGMVWLGSLIDLLAPFGMNDRLVRTSVFRLAQEGWLGAQRDGRRSNYAVMPDAQPRLSRAFRRIYSPLDTHWSGNWTLVLGTNGLDASERALMRKELLWEGYSVIAPGIACHPAGDHEALEALLQRMGMLSKVYVCQASELPGVHGKPLSDLVGEGWDLSEVITGYTKFVDLFTPLLNMLREAAEPVDPEQAFVVRSLVIHAYRRVQLHDPQLPVELLPNPWPGAAAYSLARELYRLTWEQSERHVLAMLRREDPEAPTAASSFYNRFGGLR